ncbi:MAG: cytochrome c [Nevskia sp.]
MWLAMLVFAAGADAAGPGLGQPLSAAERGALAGSSIYPDGRGLPPGQGSAREGRAIYEQRCRACHGEAGAGGSGGQLIAGESIRSPDPDRGIDNYWPYATTLFDFTRRAMPMDAPGSLGDAEVYAVTAYLLNLGGIVGAEAVLDAGSLPAVTMPNRDGFVWIDAAKPATARRR